MSASLCLVWATSGSVSATLVDKLSFSCSNYRSCHTTIADHLHQNKVGINMTSQKILYKHYKIEEIFKKKIPLKHFFLFTQAPRDFSHTVATLRLFGEQSRRVHDVTTIWMNNHGALTSRLFVRIVATSHCGCSHDSCSVVEKIDRSQFMPTKALN